MFPVPVARKPKHRVSRDTDRPGRTGPDFAIQGEIVILFGKVASRTFPVRAEGGVCFCRMSRSVRLGSNENHGRNITLQPVAA